MPYTPLSEFAKKGGFGLPSGAGDVSKAKKVPASQFPFKLSQSTLPVKGGPMSATTTAKTSAIKSKGAYSLVDSLMKKP